ncbi:cupin domain-containing protein [Niabella hibiscisoli]|uniref:cupin domain-containing protein n=1 Tax=Niabella hibiscisoli TaxID=1825928 RepID=UPI001F0F94C3|nr:cupin domain-containing protein [Niabella hibiscisoli]MCH5719567.1 cupin domain-containing protein [Niabella hibiscisoli]
MPHNNTIQKINIVQKLNLFFEYWKPKVAGELNGQQVKLVKFKGEFVWHKHDSEDEMFLVVKGSFSMHLRDKVIDLTEGEFIVIPKGVEHKPVAETEVSVMLIEPASILNTGDVISDLTAAELDHI